MGRKEVRVRVARSWICTTTPRGGGESLLWTIKIADDEGSECVDNQQPHFLPYPAGDDKHTLSE